MFNRLLRHIKNGLIGVRRHLGMAFSSASAVTITLLMLGVFGMFALNMAFLTREIEQSISLVALIDYDVVDKTTIKAMKTSIENISGVETVEYRTKDQEFDYYNEQYPDMIEFSDLYREDNPFHDTFIVYASEGSSLEAIKLNVEKINGIDSVEDGGSNTYTLISILQSTRLVGGIIIIALVALAVYLIYNTIKITIATRSDEISIMRNVGAKNSYIRAPFLVEGVVIGIIGSIIPIVSISVGYVRLYNATNGVVAGVLNLVAINPFLILLDVLLIVIGILVGYVGSYISVCKFLRLTR